MSFVTAVKDYIELLNNVYDSVSGNITTETVISQTLIFIGGSLKDFFWYLITFNWLRDIVYLPVLVPQFSSSLLLDNGFDWFGFNDGIQSLTFSTTNNFVTSKFLIGFLNSLFICLPFSCSHLISLRRLMIQGFPAGIFSSLGTILGQWWFLTCVVFGLRWFVLPWFSLESFNYIFGFVLAFSIIISMALERSIKLVPSSDKTKLVTFFLQTFVLSWTEQICIFQYFGHLTLGSEPSIFEIFSETTSKGLWFGQSTYLLGLLLGSLFFSVLFNWICLNLRDLALVQFKIVYIRWVLGFNRFAIIAGYATSLMLIPYYGTDYLLAGPLGFVSEDKAFVKSIFSSMPPKDFATLLGRHSKYRSVDTDLIPFDRARYLRNGARQTFEELNFEGENGWISKVDNRFHFLRRRKGPSIIRRGLNTVFNITNFKFDTAEDRKKILELLKQRIHAINIREKTGLGLAQKGVKEMTPKEFNSFISLTPTISKSLHSKEDQKSFSTLKEQKAAENSLMTRVKTTDYSKNLHKFLKAVGKHRRRFKQQQKSAINKKSGVLFKKKYHLNVVYKLLLNCDIDLFLSRQPKSYLLTAKQEQQLVEKRNVLATYYDSLRNYNQLSHLKWFQDFFQGSKSYADRVYNQQFKGTLFITRRLFAISLSSKKNPFQQRILKYDQPLYKSFTTDSNPILHEELQEDNITKLPFLELSKSKPFYSGWDESLRKLVVTNRFFPQKFAGMAMNVPPSNQRINYSSLYTGVKEITEMTSEEFNVYKLNEVIEFTAWPLSKNILEMPETNSKIPYTTLFETKPTFTEEELEELEPTGDPEKKRKLELFTSSSDTGKFEFETLPPNIRILKRQLLDGMIFRKFDLIMPPSRGGFVWPGNKYLQFDLIKLFKNK